MHVRCLEALLNLSMNLDRELRGSCLICAAYRWERQHNEIEKVKRYHDFITGERKLASERRAN